MKPDLLPQEARTSDSLPAPSLTDAFRRTCLRLFVVEVAAGIGGWLLGKDPSALVSIMLATVGAMTVGEASNVGKRATTKPELMPPGELCP